MSKATVKLAVVGLSLPLLALGCDYDTPATGLPASLECNSCHGSLVNAAPPVDTAGNVKASSPGVGAHQSHLRDGYFHAAFTCNTCHLVPDQVTAEGHIDPLPAEVVFGGLAVATGLEPSYDPATNTCSNVYCHGATLSGGTVTSPNWTIADGSQARCGTCHGAPPPAPHPQRPDCQACHAETVGGDGRLLPGRHLDGSVQVAISGCDACHGSAGNPAPPVDTEGNSATTARGVGAHREHLAASDRHTRLSCHECHQVPESIDAAGHLDQSEGAELVWGPLATSGSATPSWDRQAATCSGVYCHGATLSGGSNTAPVWTDVGSGQAACGSCHGTPPPAPHPDNGDCHACHPQTVDAQGELIAAAHIDGELQVEVSACDACHGSDGEAAPPLDLSGNSDPSFVGVGAHREHLAPSDWHATVACSECHQVPQALGDPGHVDSDPPAELTWGSRARADGAQPQWDRQAATCSGVYCHGATLKGTGSNREPVWTEVGQGQAACGSCHALPPEQGHPQVDTCEVCHPCVAAPGQVIRSDNAQLHINGQVNLESASNCP